MQVGQLREIIILQSPTTSATNGAVSKSYTTVTNVWARVISERGNEAFQSARINAREKLRIQIRYRSDISVTWRIIWNGRNFNVLNVDKSEKSSGSLWLTVEAVGGV